MGRGLVAVAVALASAGAPVPAHAQDRLARAEDALWEGDAATARRELAAWFENSAAGATGDQRGRALLLRARLEDDPRLAERDYLEVVHGYPTSPAAPEALLRLGQWALERAQPDRAVSYLDRLVADYPAWRRREEGRLWLAWALRAAGRHREACAAAAVVALSPDPWLAEQGQRAASGCR
jgi:outer membrane protein assembly factor BamD (BamD/ComL family)